jgi:hypothetical protein
MDSDWIHEPESLESPSMVPAVDPMAATSAEPLEPQEASIAQPSSVASPSSVAAAAPSSVASPSVVAAAAPSSAPLSTGLDVAKPGDLEQGAAARAMAQQDVSSIGDRPNVVHDPEESPSSSAR